MAQTIRQLIELEARDKTAKGINSAKKNLSSLDRFVQRVHTTMLGFVGLNIAQNLVRDFISISDEAVNLGNRLKLVTNGVKETNFVFDSLLKTSLKTGSSLASSVTLFTRMARPVKALGFSMQETLDVTELFAQGLRISGASAQEASGTLRQVSQAFASGVLRGEEFNSLMENGGRIALALADGLRVSVGELRAMSRQGELTAEIVTEALLTQKEVIAAENAQMALTISQSWENVQSVLTRYFSTHTKFNAKIAKGLQVVAENIELIISLTKILITVIVVKLGKSILANIALRAKQAADDKAKHAADLAAIEDKIVAEHRKRRTDTVAHEIAMVQHAKELAAANELILTKTSGLRAAKQAALEKEALIAAEITAERKLSAEYERSNIQYGKAKTAQTARLKNIQANTLKLATVRKELDVVTEKLTLSEKALSTSMYAVDIANGRVTRSTAAVVASNVALDRSYNTKKMTKFSGVVGSLRGNVSKLGKAFKPITGLIKGVGAALFGWVGIVAYVGYELTKNVIDYGLAWKAWSYHIDKATTFNKEKLKEIEKDWDDWSDKRIADQMAQAKGFQNAQDMERKAHAENVRSQVNEASKLDALQQKRLDEFNNIKKLRDKAYKGDLKQIAETTQNELTALNASYTHKRSILEAEITDKVTLANAILDLDQEVQGKREDILMFSLLTQQTANKEHYADLQKITTKNSEESNKLLLEELTSSKALLTKRVEFHKTNITKMKSHYDDLIDKAKEYAQSAKDIEKEAADFIKSVRRDMMTDAEKDAATEQDYREALSKIREADALDETKDAERIKVLRQEANSTLKDYVNANKAKSKSAKKGSLEELNAQNNVNTALGMFKLNNDNLVASQKASSAAFAKQATSQLELIKQQEQYINRWTAAIVKLDENINTQRELVLNLDTTKATTALNKFDENIKHSIKELNRLGKIQAAYYKKNPNQKPVEKHADGGTIGYIDDSISMQRLHGNIGGSAAQQGDTVPALLERGEFVIRKSAVNALGVDYLRELNKAVGKKSVNLYSRGGYIPIDRKVNRGGVSLGGGVPSIGKGSDDRTNRMLNDYLRELLNYEQDLGTNTGRHGGFGGVSSRAALNKYRGYAEQMRDLPNNKVRDGLQVLEDMFSLHKGDILSADKHKRLSELEGKFAKYMAKTKADAMREALSPPQTFKTPKVSTTPQAPQTHSVDPITVPKTNHTTTPTVTPVVSPVTAEPIAMEGVASGITHIRKALGVVQKQITPTAHGATAEPFQKSSKRIQIDLSMGGVSAVGDFADDENTDAIITKLEYLKRVQIK